MTGFKRSITFLEEAIVLDHNKEVKEHFKAGETIETNPASARYWINTGKAQAAVKPAKAKSADAPTAVETVKPKAKPKAKPKKTSATKTKAAPKKQAD